MSLMRGSSSPIRARLRRCSKLAERGIAQACVSNSGRTIVDANIEALGIGKIIAFSMSLEDVSAGKPDPEPYREAARRLALPAAAVVAVEDSGAGARSARAAGLYVVGYSPSGEPFVGSDRSIVKLMEVVALFEA